MLEGGRAALRATVLAARQAKQPTSPPCTSSAGFLM